MTDPMHISSFIPKAYQELLGMIERGERGEREREKEVDSQTEFDFTLSMNEHKGDIARNQQENYERTEAKS